VVINIIDTLFVIDFFTSFLVAFPEAGASDDRPITNPRRIATNYLKGYLVIDFVAAVPWELILGQGEQTKAARGVRLGRIAKMLRVTKLTKIGRGYGMFKMLVRMESTMHLSRNSQRVITLIVALALGANFIGSVWYGLHVLQQPEGLLMVEGEDCEVGWACKFKTDDDSTPIAHAPLGAKYVTSLYWAFATLTTVGYGDISATTSAEKGFSVFTMFLGATSYAYIVSMISLIMSEVSHRRAYVTLRRDRAQQYLDHFKANISKELHSKVSWRVGWRHRGGVRG
jgi:hypothetical protein